MNGWEAGLGFTISPPSPVIDAESSTVRGRVDVSRVDPSSIFWRSCAASLHGMVFLRRESGTYVNGLEEIWKWGGRRPSR